jgi:hypothetical protein
LVSELAGSLVVLHDFVVEDGKVKGETELDGVARGKGDLVSLIVGLEGVLLDFLHEGTFGVLSDVAVVVTDHLDEESLGLTVARFGENLFVDHVNDTLAVSSQLVLDLGLVVAKSRGILGVLGVLLNGGNSAASGSLWADEVLKSHWEEIALIGGDFSTFSVKDEGEEVDHVFEALCLFGNTCKENVFFNWH